MDEKLLYAIIVALVVKIIWGWLVDGRAGKGEYVTVKDYEKDRIDKSDFLTIKAFEKHRENCCAIGLKKEFNDCKQVSCTNQAKAENRLDTIEEKLRDGHATFQAMNDKMDKKFDAFSEKFDRMNKALERIQTVLEFALDRRDRGE